MLVRIRVQEDNKQQDLAKVASRLWCVPTLFKEREQQQQRGCGILRESGCIQILGPGGTRVKDLKVMIAMLL